MSLGLDGDGPGDARVDDPGGVAHDAAALAVAEQVHHRAHRPLYDAGDKEGHEPQRRPDELAPARVLPGPALHARRERHGGYLAPALLLARSLLISSYGGRMLWLLVMEEASRPAGQSIEALRRGRVALCA